MLLAERCLVLEQTILARRYIDRYLNSELRRETSRPGTVHNPLPAINKVKRVGEKFAPSRLPKALTTRRVGVLIYYIYPSRCYQSLRLESSEIFKRGTARLFACTCR